MRPPGLQSLRVRLLVFLLAAIALTAAVQGALAYRSALAEADALFDYHMQQTAFALRAGLPPDAKGMGNLRPEYENHDFIVQVWSNEGLRIFESALGAWLPQQAVLGFHEVQARGRSYRVFSLQTPAQVIQVAQDMAVRRALARGLALRSLLPLAVMAALLALAVWWLLGRLFAPVERVRGQLALRHAEDLSPVDEAQVPSEVQPLVQEFNALLARMRRAFAAQQEFVADAAHELRSPLAALALQLHSLRQAQDAASRSHAQERLQQGIERATRLVEQLLLLARQEANADAAAPVDMTQVLALALADMAPAAQAHGIDLGVVAQPDAPVLIHGQAEPLRIALRNLLDNAIKYTPSGGQVDVSLLRQADALELWVEDSGPGVPEAERERVLARFYRAPQQSPLVPGNGLGLAIVQAIARQHQGQLTLGRSARLGGLQVVLRLPARSAL